MKLNALRKRANQEGFTLIELMIVVAIIGILAAIAIPNFLGMQEKAKRRAIEEGAASAKAELHSWLDATLKGEQGVIDLDGNGVIAATEGPCAALTNVVPSWINAFYTKKGATQPSPWNNANALFTVDAAAAGTGQVVLSRVNNNRGVVIRGYDNNGNLLIQDSVSVD